MLLGVVTIAVPRNLEQPGDRKIAAQRGASRSEIVTEPNKFKKSLCACSELTQRTNGMPYNLIRNDAVWRLGEDEIQRLVGRTVFWPIVKVKAEPLQALTVIGLQ